MRPRTLSALSKRHHQSGRQAACALLPFSPRLPPVLHKWSSAVQSATSKREVSRPPRTRRSACGAMAEACAEKGLHLLPRLVDDDTRVDAVRVLSASSICRLASILRVQDAHMYHKYHGSHLIFPLFFHGTAHTHTIIACRCTGCWRVARRAVRLTCVMNPTGRDERARTTP